MFFNLNNAETNETVQKQAQTISPMLSEFGNDIRLNKHLFERVKLVYDQRNSLNLSAEQSTLLEKKYKSFAAMELIFLITKSKISEILIKN